MAIDSRQAAIPYLDISAPIRPAMPVFEGDPPVELVRVAAIAGGAVANVSRLGFGVHTGTHIDAPSHFIEGAAAAEAIPLDACIGPALVVDATAWTRHPAAADIDALGIPPGTHRLLLKTSNSRLWEREGFSPDFLGLTEPAARRLVELGLRLVGIDYLSIAPFGDPAPTHVALLQSGVVILEGLDLRGVAAGAYELVALPLRLEGSDGAPTRALLRPAARRE